jgi:hypothetical protein
VVPVAILDPGEAGLLSRVGKSAARPARNDPPFGSIDAPFGRIDALFGSIDAPDRHSIWTDLTPWNADLADGGRISRMSAAR